MSPATRHATRPAAEPSPWIIDLSIDDEVPADDQKVAAGRARRRLSAALAEARAATDALGALEVSTRSPGDARPAVSAPAVTTVDPLGPPATTAWDMVVTWS